MADNIAVTQGSGTVVATDEVTRNSIQEHQQIIKIGLGDDGDHDGLVSTATPMPVGVRAVQAWTTSTSSAAISAYGNITTADWFLFQNWTGTNIAAVRIVNGLDIAIELSFDDGTSKHYVVLAGDTLFINFIAMGFYWEGSKVKVRPTYGQPNASSGFCSFETFRYGA